MSVEYGDAFEELMGQQLRAHADAHRGPSPRPAQARYHAAYVEDRRQVSIFAKAAALASTKAAVGLIAGAVAVSAAGASEAFITNSANPVDWVATLRQQAQACSTALAPGSAGVGACMETFIPKGNKSGGKGQGTDRTKSNSANHSPGTPSGKAGGGPPADKHGAGQPGATPGAGNPGGHTPSLPPTSLGHGGTKSQDSHVTGGSTGTVLTTRQPKK